MQVEIYRNLNNGLLSVRGPRGLVLGHCSCVCIRGATYFVSPSGKKRVLTTKSRNVHAWVTGEIIRVMNFVPYKGRGEELVSLPRIPTQGKVPELEVCKTMKEVLYKPFEDRGFHTRDSEEVNHSEVAFIHKSGHISAYFKE